MSPPERPDSPDGPDFPDGPDPDDAPDLTEAPWAEGMEAALCARARPCRVGGADPNAAAHVDARMTEPAPSSTPEPVSVLADEVEAAGVQLPGATPEGVLAQLLNLDGARGLVATIIHLKPGATIPAHFHRNGAEAHYVLEGELIDAGRRFGPGAYLTHAANVVHGPHSSETGCKVLTVQGAPGTSSEADFHLVDDETDAEGGREGGGHGAQARGDGARAGSAETRVAALPAGHSATEAPSEPDDEPGPGAPRATSPELPGTGQAEATSDNPTNPGTG